MDRLPTPILLGFPCGSAGKESTCNAGDLGLTPGLGRSPWEENGYPLHRLYMDCIVHGITKNQTQLSQLKSQPILKSDFLSRTNEDCIRKLTYSYPSLFSLSLFIFWGWEILRARGEVGNRGWDGWIASPTQWTWVWESSGWWWRIGKPGVRQSMRLQRIGHNWATEQQQNVYGNTCL